MHYIKRILLPLSSKIVFTIFLKEIPSRGREIFDADYEETKKIPAGGLLYTIHEDLENTQNYICV